MKSKEMSVSSLRKITKFIQSLDDFELVEAMSDFDGVLTVKGVLKQPQVFDVFVVQNHARILKRQALNIHSDTYSYVDVEGNKIHGGTLNRFFTSGSEAKQHMMNFIDDALKVNASETNRLNKERRRIQMLSEKDVING